MKSKTRMLLNDVCISTIEQTMTEPVTFADVLEIRNGQNQKTVENPVGQYPIYGSGGVMGRADKFICPAETVVIGRKGSINNPIFVSEPFWNVDTAFGLIPDKSRLLPRYLYYFCLHFDFERLNTTVTIPSLTKANLLKIHIKLPSLPEQQKCVAVLDKIVSIFEKRRAQLAALDELVKARFVEMFGDPVGNPMGWPVCPLARLCAVGSSKRIYQNELSSAGVPFWRISDLVTKMDTGEADSGIFIPENLYEELRQAHLVPVEGDILVTSRGTLGRCYVVQKQDRFYFQDGMISWLHHYTGNLTPCYLKHLFSMPGIGRQIEAAQAGSTVAYLSISMLKNLRIMLPTKELQERFASFVARVEKLKATIQRSLAETQRLFDSQLQGHFG